MRIGNDNAETRNNECRQIRQSRKPSDNKLEQKMERHIAQVIARLLNNKTTYFRGDWE